MATPDPGAIAAAQAAQAMQAAQLVSRPGAGGQISVGAITELDMPAGMPPPPEAQAPMSLPDSRQPFDPAAQQPKPQTTTPRRTGVNTLEKLTQAAVDNVKKSIGTPVVAQPAVAPVAAPVATSDIPTDLGVAPVATEPQDAPPAPTDPKANHAWATVRKEAKELKEAVAAEKAEKAQLAADLAAERESRKALEAEYQQNMLPQSPAFKAKYDDKLYALQSDLAAKIKAMVPIEEAKILPLVRQLMTAPPAEVTKALEQLPHLIPEVTMARVAASKLVDERAKALTDWETTRLTLKEQEARENRIKFATESVSAVSEAVSNLAKTGNFVLSESASDQAWNQQRAEIIQKATAKITSSPTQKELIELAVAGETAPVLLQRLQALSAENRQLRELAGVAAMPAASSVRPIVPLPPPAPVDPNAKPRTAKPLDVVTRTMAAMRGSTAIQNMPRG